MSGPIGSSQWMYATDAGYNIDQSLRFNDADDHYLNRVGTTGDRQKWTWSGWLKRSTLGNINAIFSEGGTGSSFALYFWSDNTILAQARNSSSNRFVHQTSALFRDTSAWYHVVYAHDSTQATDTDRVNLYVNGVEQSIVAVGGNTLYPPLNENVNINFGGNHSTGYAATNSFKCFDGYMAEVHFVDGQQLNATDFGELSNGVWVPKEYSGSYGTNGYRLTFSSNSFTDNASDPDVFADQAGSNNHNAYNFTASDIVPDSPTNSFCTLNPLTHGTYPTLKEGALSIATAYSADLCGVTSTWYPTTGKWYWEIHAEGSTSTYPYLGITDQRMTMVSATTGSFYSVAWHRAGGSAVMSGTNTYMGTITNNNVATWTNNDIIMFALDVDARKLWVGKNGTWDGSGDPAAGTGEDASWTVDTGVSPLWMGYQSQGVDSVFNFGQDGTFAGNQTAQGNADENGVGDFYYSPPTGFLAMATSNIAEPTIGPNSTTTSDEHFNTLLYTGDNTASRAITGTGFQADLIWLKARNTASYHHQLHDSVRGASAGALYSSLTNAEDSSYPITSFDSDGFTTKSGVQNGQNTSNTYVAWNWKAGGTAVSNTDGSITSSVSVNDTALFSIGTYTGNGTVGATVGHGLGVAPNFLIIKNRSAAQGWPVKAVPPFAGGTRVQLESTSASTTEAAGTGSLYNATNPSSSVITLGDQAMTNTNGNNYVFYAFANVDGYCKSGSYYGNGSTDGIFVYTGFRPAWVMVKGAGNTYSWYIHDSTRDTFNHTDAELAADSAGAEYSAEGAGGGERSDFLSNGFKIRTSNVGWNQSGITYIYLAFAEAPFKHANAR